MRVATLWAALAEVLDIVPPRVRFEAKRKSIHVFGSIVAVFAFLVLPFWWAVAAAVLIIAIIAVSHFARRRRTKVPAPLDLITEPIGDALDATRRPHEDFPWAPVTFVVALIVVGSAITFASFDKSFAFAAFGILGVGDAASALIGVAYGRHKLPWNRKKSWEGSAAGFVASFVSALLLASLDYSVRGLVLPLEWASVALAGAVAGTFIETLPGVEDNLFVPIGALAAMLGAAAVVGLL